MKACVTFNLGLYPCVWKFFCPFLDFMQIWNRCYGLELNKVSESQDVIVQPLDWLWVVLFSFTFSDLLLSSTPPPPDLHVKVKVAKPICVSLIVHHCVNVTLNYSEVSVGLDRHRCIGCEQVKVSYILCWINNVTIFDWYCSGEQHKDVVGRIRKIWNYRVTTLCSRCSQNFLLQGLWQHLSCLSL